MRKLNSNQQIILSNRTLSLYMLLLIHVITKGYGVWGTKIKGQNALAPTTCLGNK